MTEKDLEIKIKETRKEYFKQWRAKNPDKVRKHNENYWRRRAEAQISAEDPKAGENNEN